MAKTSTPLTIDQLACFESATRVAVYGTLRSYGPLSIRELAGHLGARPDALYYHMRLLVDSGLASIHETREKNGRKEAIYAIEGGPYDNDRLLPDPTYQAAALRSMQSISRHAQRNFKKAVTTLKNHPENEERIAFHWINARLKPATIRKILKKLDELIVESMKNEEGDAERMMFFALAAPVVGKEKSTTGSKKAVTQARK
jgi:DNA-binding transcriptional ArsR family regulator